MNRTDVPELLTVDEFAKALKIHMKTFRRRSLWVTCRRRRLVRAPW